MSARRPERGCTPRRPRRDPAWSYPGEWSRRAGRACRRRRARHGPSSRFLRWTSVRSLARGGRLEDFLHLGEDGVDRALGVDTYEYAFRTVVLDDRLGRLVEDLEAVPDDLRGVVGAPLLEGAPVQPLDGELVRHLEEEDGQELAVDLLQHAVEGLGLGCGARQAGEDEAFSGVRHAEALPDELDHEVVGDEIARVVDGLDAHPHLRL